MHKGKINLFFNRIRNLHTFAILILVIILMTSVFYTYTCGALTNINLDSSYFFIILITLINLFAVFYTTGIVSKIQRRCDIDAEINQKTSFYRKAYLQQMLIISFFIIIDDIIFLLSANKLLFLISFAVLIFLLSLNPSKEKFIKHTPLSEAEKNQLD